MFYPNVLLPRFLHNHIGRTSNPLHIFGFILPIPTLDRQEHHAVQHSTPLSSTQFLMKMSSALEFARSEVVRNITSPTLECLRPKVIIHAQPCRLLLATGVCKILTPSRLELTRAVALLSIPLPCSSQWMRRFLRCSLRALLHVICPTLMLRFRLGV